MNKQEVYYKFILTDYHSLTYKTGDQNFVPTDDGSDQLGEVRALCVKCPERVITYDQLTASNPISMYVNGANGWTSTKKSAIKSYIDAWLSEPKYFNLRNYWDASPSQEGGMSLMVSHTPEVGGDYGDWTKLRVNGKTVYFSLMVSSGDFFYGFTLPDKVIKKSGLRDKIVNDRFHSNWFFTPEEKTVWRDNDIFNVDVGQEKRVFVQHYFHEGYPYGYQASPKFFVYYYSGDSKYLRESVSCVDVHGNIYRGTNKDFPPHTEISRYYLTDNTSVTLTRSQRYTSSDVTRNGSQYFLNSDPSIEVSPIRTVELYVDFNEDLKRDFIDLEATRRILYYDDTNNSDIQLKYTDNGNTSYVVIQPTGDIPKILSGDYYSTELSYEPPDVYLSDRGGCPPMQIPYNLLRYTLNDRPPFTDCETVLVMWVADSGDDPDDVADNDVRALHDLNWQQYAIPMSIRCCYKQPVNGERLSKERFLVSYPCKWNVSKTPRESTYRFHMRCNEAYSKNEFREALYLRDLIEYSEDYVITYHCTSYYGTKYYDLDKDGVKETQVNYSDLFNIQKYILQRRVVDGVDAFKKLYAKKCYVNLSMNQQQQVYYLSVPNDQYGVNPNIARLAACFTKKDTTDTLFAPSTVLTRESYKHWDFDDVTYEDDYGLNDWRVDDSRFIALFDASSPIFSTVTGEFEIVNAGTLREYLLAKVPTYASWDDIYISSLGISNSNQINDESVMSSSNGCTHFSIGFLDNHIKIGGTTYGRDIGSTNKKVVVGFKKLFDYKYEGLYHFHYDEESNSYKSVVSTYNSTTGDYDLTERPVTCTAYVMDYS